MKGGVAACARAAQIRRRPAEIIIEICVPRLQPQEGWPFELGCAVLDEYPHSIHRPSEHGHVSWGRRPSIDNVVWAGLLGGPSRGGWVNR